MFRIFAIIVALLVNLNATEKKEKQPKFTCGNKKTCKQMTSCAEAMFYLKECRVKRLDRDKDGIPCESICR